METAEVEPLGKYTQVPVYLEHRAKTNAAALH